MTAHVLVVSARPAFVQAVSASLRSLPCSVVVATELESGCRRVRADLPAVVLVDLVGLAPGAAALCEGVREQDGGFHVPILLCGSGREEFRSSTDVLIAGGDDFLLLPLEAHQIAGRIAGYLGATPPASDEELILDATPPPRPPRAAARGPPAAREVGAIPVPIPIPISVAERLKQEPAALTPELLAVPRAPPPAAEAAITAVQRPSANEMPGELTLEQAEIGRALEEAAHRAAFERVRTGELERQRRAAEAEVRAAVEEARGAEASERHRPAKLEASGATAQAEVAAALDALRQQMAVEEERLAQLRRAREAEEARREAEEAPREAKEARREAEEARREAEEARREAEEAPREAEEARREAGPRRRGFWAGRFDPPSSSAMEPAPASAPAAIVAEVSEGPGLSPLDAEPPTPPPIVPLEPLEGRFAEGELPALLWACHHLRVTGAVELLLSEGRARILYLEEGEPVLVMSSLPADRPEEGLLRAGLITTARYHELRAGPWRSPRRTAAALVAEGALKPEELFPATRGMLTEQVLSLLEHDAGLFRFRAEHAPAADRARLEHALDVIVAEGVRRKFDARRLWIVLGGPGSIVGPDDRARRLPPLSPEEKVALGRFDGTRSFEDIILETAIAPEVVLRTALMAVSCGAARVLARGTPADPAERLAQHERSVAIDRGRIMDRLHAARHSDYFTFLGVEPSASPFEVQRAAARVRQRFDPRRHLDPAFADLEAALREIVEVSHDAETVLADPPLADGYRRHMETVLPRLQRRRA